MPLHLSIYPEQNLLDKRSDKNVDNFDLIDWPNPLSLSPTPSLSLSLPLSLSCELSFSNLYKRGKKIEGFHQLA